MCILADGRAVCSCIDAIAQHTLGDIHESRLYDIFNDYHYQNLRNHLLNLTVPELCTFCPLRQRRTTRRDRLVMPTIETVQIEIANACDLKCPQCTLNLVRRPDHAGALMSYETFTGIIDQLKGPLRSLKFYNYGEPFIHKDCMRMLRYVKEADPRISVLINTNGTQIGPERQKELVDLGIDMLVFSVDGTTQESYEQYRVGGDLATVLGNMRGVLEYRKREGKRIPKVLWQYILFEWNDSDEEILRAKRMAVEMEVDVLHWLLTHTPGASRRFTGDTGPARQLLVRDGLGRRCTDFYLDASPVIEADEHSRQIVNLKWKTRYRRARQLLSSFGSYTRG
jgi:wyosine [tRNA(Phe)-imidazoG37] synthetase (radical SAM superfamily)